MSNEEAHEYYGWLAHRENFFTEWRDEVCTRILTNKISEHQLRNRRADVSKQVFEEMVFKKQNFSMKEMGNDF